MSDGDMPALDENTRRYYLDMMGVQSWQLLQPASDTEPQAETQTDTVSATAGVAKVAEEAALVETTLVEAKEAPLTWSSLDNNVQVCDRCQLQQTRSKAVAGHGNQSARLMIVMLSVDMDAEASALLTKMLAAINIKLEDVYITSLLKCDLPAQHTVSTLEIKACSHFLNQQIRLLQPKQLFVLGETAARCLYQKNVHLDDLRAQVNNDAGMPGAGHDSGVAAGTPVPDSPVLSEPVSLLLSYSPQELLQQPENKRKSWSDLQLLQKRMQA